MVQTQSRGNSSIFLYFIIDSKFSICWKMEKSQVYLFEVNDPKDHVRVRNWAIENGMYAHACYDIRHRPNYIFKCADCEKAYSLFDDLLRYSIDEHNGRVYSEMRVCCEDCYMVYSEGSFSGNGIYLRCAPNAIIVTPEPLATASRRKQKGGEIPKSIPDPTAYEELKKYIRFQENLPDSITRYVFEDSDTLLSIWEKYTSS